MSRKFVEAVGACEVRSMMDERSNNTEQNHFFVARVTLKCVNLATVGCAHQGETNRRMKMCVTTIVQDEGIGIARMNMNINTIQ